MNGNVDTDDFTPDNPSVDVVGKLSFKEKVGYGLGDTASNLYWKLFENFQLIFYTDVFGISAAAAATDVFRDQVVGCGERSHGRISGRSNKDRLGPISSLSCLGFDPICGYWHSDFLYA